MAELTKEEAEQLEALQTKKDAPEPEPNGGGPSRVLNISIDLGDEEQIKRGIGLGLLTAPQVDELKGDDDDKGDDDKGDEGPQRRGFFGEGDK